MVPGEEPGEILPPLLTVTLPLTVPSPLSVPPDWTVNSYVTPLMGGMEDKADRRENDPNKRLTIKGFVMMGGVEVKN